MYRKRRWPVAVTLLLGIALIGTMSLTVVGQVSFTLLDEDFEDYRTYPIDPGTGLPMVPETPDCTGYPDEPAAIAAGWEFDAVDATPWKLVDECELWGMAAEYPTLIPFASTIQAAYCGYVNPNTGTASYEGIHTEDPVLRSPMVALNPECLEVDVSFDYWREVEYYPDGAFDQTWVEIAFYDNQSPSVIIGTPKQIWYRDSGDVSAAAWLSSGYLNEAIPAGAAFVQVSFHFEAVDNFGNDYAGWFIDNVVIECSDGPQRICWLQTTSSILPQGYIDEGQEEAKYSYDFAPYVTAPNGSVRRFYLAVGTEDGDCDCGFGDCRKLTERDPYPLPERLTLSTEGVLQGTITPDMQGNYTFWVMVETSGLRDGNCACHEFHLVIRADGTQSGAIYEYPGISPPTGDWYLCGQNANPTLNLWNETNQVSGVLIPDSDGGATPEYALYFGQPSPGDYDTGKQVKGCFCIDLSSYVSGKEGSEVELGFKHWREVEYYAGGSFDQTWVEMSTDGVLWQKVDDLFWDSTDACVEHWLWEQLKTGIIITGAEELYLRFCFDSVDGFGNDFLGWVISEVMVWLDEPQLELATCPLPAGYVGEPYNHPIVYAGGTPVTNPTVTGLPEGLEVVSGKIVGTPRPAGTFPITIEVPGVDTEECDLVIHEQRCFFHEDFEDDPVWVWTGLWTRVGPTAATFGNPGTEPCPIAGLEPDLATNHVAYYGDPVAMTYNTGDRTTGLLSLLDLPAGLDVEGVGYIELTFDSCREVEQFSSGYDQTKVQVRFDTGNTWYTVWYKDSSHPNGGWEAEVANHGTPFAVPTGATKMWVRFVFDSVDRYYNQYFGWMIDNIWICYADEGGPIAAEDSYYNAHSTISRRSSVDELSVMNFPNPVTDVHTTTFTVRGEGVEAIKIQIFDQNETLVFEQQVEGQELEWHTDNNYGEFLANGTYFYRAYARVDGEWIPTRFEKLVILR